MIIAGLDRRIIIQSPTETRAANGEVLESWATLATVWAGVKYPKSMGSDEGIEQGRFTATTPVEFTIRFRSDVTTKMRISYQGGYFQIARINEIGRRDMLKLVTEKKY